MSNQSLLVHLNVTHACNLDCSFCYIPKKERDEGGRMSFEKMDIIFDGLRDVLLSEGLPYTRIELVFLGGEPSLMPITAFHYLEEKIKWLRGCTDEVLIETSILSNLVSSRSVDVAKFFGSVCTSYDPVGTLFWGERGYYS